MIFLDMENRIKDYYEKPDFDGRSKIIFYSYCLLIAGSIYMCDRLKKDGVKFNNLEDAKKNINLLYEGLK